MYTKSDLRTGDIVVTRDGSLGVVILDTNIILYQNNGFDDLDLFTEDLMSDDECRQCDIMEVYDGHEGAIGFLDYNGCDPIFRREE